MCILQSFFSYGLIQHEMFHMLGFYHEHSRTDRDDYVKILWQNILNGMALNNNCNLSISYHAMSDILQRA